MTSHFGGLSPFLKSRTERERLLFVAAAGLAVSLLIIVLLVVNFKRQASASADRSPSAGNNNIASVAIGTVSLIAPERLIPKGAKLSEMRFKEVYWPRNEVPEEVVRDVSELVNYYAKEDLRPGIPIQRSSLTKEISKISLPLTPGMRAVSIEVDATSSLEGHALPGTRVDVVLTHHGEDQKLISKVIVQNARVLSAGGDVTPLRDRSPVDKPVPNAVKTITLEVSTEDALKIQTARQMGRLSLIMRAAEDVKAVEKTDMAQEEVINNTASGKRNQKNAGCQNRGKMRMGGKEYIIDCEGNINEIVDPNEP